MSSENKVNIFTTPTNAGTTKANPNYAPKRRTIKKHASARNLFPTNNSDKENDSKLDNKVEGKTTLKK
jgi:hypothetical protein